VRVKNLHLVLCQVLLHVLSDQSAIITVTCGSLAGLETYGKLINVFCRSFCFIRELTDISLELGQLADLVTIVACALDKWWHVTDFRESDGDLLDLDCPLDDHVVVV